MPSVPCEISSLGVWVWSHDVVLLCYIIKRRLPRWAGFNHRPFKCTAFSHWWAEREVKDSKPEKDLLYWCHFKDGEGTRGGSRQPRGTENRGWDLRPVAPRIWLPLRAWMSLEAGSYPEPPDLTPWFWPCGTLNRKQPNSDFWPTELWDNKWCCYKLLSLW